MAESKGQKYVKHIVFSLLSRVIMFVLGIIIPRLIIVNYGSGVNGLLSSVGDIFSYIALIEAGVGVAATQALYKPLADNNRDQISGVLVATRNYFRKLIKWYLIAMIGFACVYPLITTSDFSYPLIFGIIFIQGFSNVLTYYFSSTLSQLLVADGREYASQIISLGTFVLNSVLKIVLLSFDMSLIWVQCGYLIVNLLHIAVIALYVRRKYPWIDWNVTPASNALAKRNKYLVNSVAWTVFSSTDTVLIAIFCGFAVTSIYSVYNLVFSNLSVIVVTFYSGMYFVLGQTFHESKEKYVKLHTEIETILTGMSFAVFSTAYVLILPFVSLYTKGADIEYADAYLPILFCLVQVLSNSRLLSGHVINVHNQPQLINKDSVIEVCLNIIVSVILVYFIGIYGVLVGTIVAMLYRSIRLIYVANRKLLNRSPYKTYMMYLANLLTFGGVMVFNHFIKPAITGYVSFVIYGVIYTAVLSAIYLTINLVLNPGILSTFKTLLKRNRKMQDMTT